MCVCGDFEILKRSWTGNLFCCAVMLRCTRFWGIEQSKAPYENIINNACVKCLSRHWIPSPTTNAYENFFYQQQIYVKMHTHQLTLVLRSPPLPPFDLHILVYSSSASILMLIVRFILATSQGFAEPEPPPLIQNDIIFFFYHSRTKSMELRRFRVCCSQRLDRWK